MTADDDAKLEAIAMIRMATDTGQRISLDEAFKATSLPCTLCGAQTNPEYRPDPDSPGDRIPAWQCLNIDCLHLER